MPNKYELLSFLQCLKILNRYKFSLVIPSGLNVEFYLNYLKKMNILYSLEEFDSSFFSNINGYNKLMLSQLFYNQFKHSDYILIYQLDSFVFKDELEKWCNLGYDYIGAPWLFVKKKIYFVGSGNGGFSLRNPKKIIEYLDSGVLKMNIWGYWNLYSNYNFLKKFIRIPKILLTTFGYKNNKSYYITRIGFNEDYVFGYIPNYSKDKLKIAPANIALQFAFDIYPNILFEKNNKKLPFGCHGWYKFDENLSFWKQFIEI